MSTAVLNLSIFWTEVKSGQTTDHTVPTDLLHKSLNCSAQAVNDPERMADSQQNRQSLRADSGSEAYKHLSQSHSRLSGKA